MPTPGLGPRSSLCRAHLYHMPHLHVSQTSRSLWQVCHSAQLSRVGGGVSGEVELWPPYPPRLVKTTTEDRGANTQTTVNSKTNTRIDDHDQVSSTLYVSDAILCLSCPLSHPAVSLRRWEALLSPQLTKEETESEASLPLCGWPTPRYLLALHHMPHGAHHWVHSLPSRADTGLSLCSVRQAAADSAEAPACLHPPYLHAHMPIYWEKLEPSPLWGDVYNPGGEGPGLASQMPPATRNHWASACPRPASQDRGAQGVAQRSMLWAVWGVIPLSVQLLALDAPAPVNSPKRGLQSGGSTPPSPWCCAGQRSSQDPPHNMPHLLSEDMGRGPGKA